MIRIARITRCKKLLLLASAVLLIFGLPLSKKPPAVLAAQIGSSAIAPATLHGRYFAAPNGDENANKGGEITIAQPKVWQYERVNSLLDGLLRDVEGVSLADLTRLDPNQQNAAAIRFVQSALGISVTYDQAAQVNANNTLQTFQARQNSEVRQLNEYNNYMQGLTAQRDSLTQQIFANNRQIVSLQSQQEQGTLSADQASQLKAATDRSTTLNAQLKDVNGMISGAGPAPTLTAPPTMTGTSATAPALPAQPALGDLLKSLPDSVQKSIGNALQSPTYPSTKQLDNFITLLHERLAREISVMQDDLIRDPNTLAYLVQFDVGLYPSNKNKNQMARVAFELRDCQGCKVYSLYPGQSSYNVTNYQGSTKRRTFAGNMLTLIGLGISGNYQRQEDALKGSLVQSVYISGFQDDLEAQAEQAKTANTAAHPAYQRFGWYYNAAPFDEYVTPGIRSTFAIITVPREKIGEFKKDQNERRKLPFTIQSGWAKRDKPLHFEHDDESLISDKVVNLLLPGTESLVVVPDSVRTDKQRLHVLRMEYETFKYPKNVINQAAPPAPAASVVIPASASRPASSANGCNKGECATILLTLDAPIDPNLVITANGLPLRRVRDWRGRGTSVLPPVQSLSDLGSVPSGGTAPKTEVVSGRSLLETDQLEANSWFAVSSHDLLLSISRDIAGETDFPVIQISDPAKRTLVIPNDVRQNFTEIITGTYRFRPTWVVADYTRRTFGRRKTTPPSNTAASKMLSSNAPGSNPAPQKAPGSEDSSQEVPGQGGPYPYSTFVPLFLPESPAQKFYAFVGQTGEDLIIGFLDQQDKESKSAAGILHFSETHTRVVLEDPDIDLAWSLSCYIQGKELVCKTPIEAIRQSYAEVAGACRGENEENICPSIEAQIEPVRQRLVAGEKDKRFSKSDGASVIASKFTHAFVPRLQVWVEQYDPEGKNSFWSAEPAKVGLFPLSRDFTQDDRPFESWRFYDRGTTADAVALEECNYFAGTVQSFELKQGACKAPTPGGGATIKVRYLTPIEFPITPASQCLSLLRHPEESEACRYLTVPTSTLQRDEVVLEMTYWDHPNSDSNTNPLHWTEALVAARLRPAFGPAHVSPTRYGSNGNFGIKEWKVRIPVKRILCSDVIDEAAQLKAHELSIHWMDGEKELKSDPLCDRDQWRTAQNTNRLALELTIPKAAAPYLPEELHVVRTMSIPNPSNAQEPNSMKVTVATLQNFRSLILPSKLKVDPTGENQFALRGKNAGVIDRVAVQNGAVNKNYPAGQGLDVAVVSTIEKKQVAQPAPGTPKKEEVEVLPSGTYALLPLMRLGDVDVPIESTDDQGNALTYTIPAKKKDVAGDNPAATPDETVTITKTTKKPAPTATPSPTPAK